MADTRSQDATRCLVRLFGVAFLFWFGLSLLLPTLPLYLSTELGFSDGSVGWVIGAFAAGLLLFRPWVGQLADQRSRVLVIRIGLLAAATAPLGYLVVHTIPLLIILRIYHGLSIAAFTTGYLALVTDLTPTAGRGRILGYMTMAQPVGVALGPALGGYVAEWWGYTPLFLLAAGLGMAALLWCLMGIPMRPAAHPSQGRAALWTLLLAPRLRIPALVLLLVGLVFGTLQIFIPLLIQREGIPMNPGLFYTAVALSSLLARFVVGRGLDRLGRGRFITLSLGCYLVAMLTLQTADRVSEFLAAGLVEGLGSGILIPAMAALIADRSYPRERGRTFGLCLGGFDLGIALAGPVMGAVASGLSIRGLFSITASLAALALAVFVTQGGKTLADSLRFALTNNRDAYQVQES
ncbi:MAG: MFS transporter [Gloeomargaritaceae cyanobacterium C42_A2020_066]|nr:MFS transporter [Gloeomargaritaceae cyanobacterium C42_A2020_066]